MTLIKIGEYVLNSTHVTCAQYECYTDALVKCIYSTDWFLFIFPYSLRIILRLERPLKHEYNGREYHWVFYSGFQWRENLYGSSLDRLYCTRHNCAVLRLELGANQEGRLRRWYDTIFHKFLNTVVVYSNKFDIRNNQYKILETCVLFCCSYLFYSI